MDEELLIKMLKNSFKLFKGEEGSIKILNILKIGKLTIYSIEIKSEDLERCFILTRDNELFIIKEDEFEERIEDIISNLDKAKSRFTFSKRIERCNYPNLDIEKSVKRYENFLNSDFYKEMSKSLY